MVDDIEGQKLIKEETINKHGEWAATGIKFAVKDSPSLKQQGSAKHEGLFAECSIPKGYVLPYTGKLLSAAEHSAMPDDACEYVTEVLYFHDLPYDMRE